MFVLIALSLMVTLIAMISMRGEPSTALQAKRQFIVKLDRSAVRLIASARPQIVDYVINMENSKV